MLTNGLVVLSAVLLSAHFLRTGSVVAMVLCLMFPALLFVRRPWSLLVVRGMLLLGSLEWLRTLFTNVTQRQAAGEPWLRMALILGLVAGLTAVSALVAHRRT